jgi:hypothetical protein
MSWPRISPDYRRRPWPLFIRHSLPTHLQRYGMPRNAMDARHLLRMAERLANVSTDADGLQAIYREVRPLALRVRHAQEWPVRLAMMLRASRTNQRQAKRYSV